MRHNRPMMLGFGCYICCISRIEPNRAKQMMPRTHLNNGRAPRVRRFSHVASRQRCELEFNNGSLSRPMAEGSLAIYPCPVVDAE